MLQYRVTDPSYKGLRRVPIYGFSIMAENQTEGFVAIGELLAAYNVFHTPVEVTVYNTRLAQVSGHYIVDLYDMRTKDNKRLVMWRKSNGKKWESVTFYSRY